MGMYMLQIRVVNRLLGRLLRVVRGEEGAVT